MVEIVGVKFNNAGKMYYFDPNSIKVKMGEKVLVETARGVEMGKIVAENTMVPDEEVVAPLKPIIRIATEADLKQEEENRKKEKEAFDITVKKIAEHNLDMKLVDAEYTFDRSKILFYFTADGRVDFRELVKTLASEFKTRIELRQIGVRDEARQLGGLGICGRPLCCNSFLNDFHPVSIKMAKEQGLSLNPTKISGVCGRLMCCLQYEQNAYEDMLKKLPNKGEKVETPDGVGIVSEVATLKGQVKVRFSDSNGEMIKFETYGLGDFKCCGRRCRNAQEEEPEIIMDEELKAIAEEEISVPDMVNEEENAPKKSKENNPNKGNKSNKRHKFKKKNNGNKQKKPDGEKKEDKNSEKLKGGYTGGYSQE